MAVSDAGVDVMFGNWCAYDAHCPPFHLHITHFWILFPVHCER